MNREGHLLIAGTPSSLKCLEHELPPVALLLKLRLKCDAKLGRFGVHGRQADADRKQSHPAGAGISPAHLGDDADIRRLPPIFCVDADAWVLKDLEWPKPRRRRIPQCDVEPVPELVLVFRGEGGGTGAACVA